MKLAILGSTESWYVQDLRRAAGARHAIVPVTFRDVSAWIGSGGARIWSRPAKSAAAERLSIDLGVCDAILVRTMPLGSLEQVVFRMDALARLEAAGIPVMNPPKALETAVDKYLTLDRLVAAGLRVPRTIVCQTADEAMNAFEQLGGRVVVKPLFGGEGRGITRLDDREIAFRAFHMLEHLGAILYIQEWIEHEGCDLRLFVIRDEVLGMRRINLNDWRTNVSRGARTEPIDVTPDLETLALQAAAAVGAPLAGVDLLPGRDGQGYLLEVNAVPGWRALARILHVDIARKVLELLESG
ncbi:MAG: RimK family alpha-L-glutamate ligase [Pirellulales bacterium]|nr:RimK family alpha-L-glutamate ligase [Pirellulales bacterium]